MIKMTILIDSVEKIRSFNRDIMQIEGDCDIVSGAYTIDAKSVMGLFSLDVSSPIKLIIHDDGADLSRIRRYETEDAE